MTIKNGIPILIILFGIALRYYVIGSHAVPHVDSCSTLSKVNLKYKKGRQILKDKASSWIGTQELKEELFKYEDSKIKLKKLFKELKASNHPPAYYTLLHIVKVTFDGDSKSMRSGYILNLILWILSAYIFFLIVKRLFNNNTLASISLLLYSCSLGSISALILLKGYVLQELIFLCLIYLVVVQSTKKELTVLDYISYGICCFVLFLIHYFSYPLIAIFSITLFLYYQPIRKKRNRILRYGLVTIIAICFAIWIYPNIIKDVFHNSRSVQIQNKLFTSGELEGLLKVNFRFLYQYILTLPTIILVIGGLVQRITQIKSDKFFMLKKMSDSEYMSFLLIGFSIVAFVILCYLAPYTSIRYISALIPILLFGVVYFSRVLIIKGKWLIVFFTSVVILFTILQLVFTQLDIKKNEDIVQTWTKTDPLKTLDKNQSILIVFGKDRSYAVRQIIYRLSTNEIAFSQNVIDWTLIDNRKKLSIMIDPRIEANKKKELLEELRKHHFFKVKISGFGYSVYQPLVSLDQ